MRDHRAELLQKIADRSARVGVIGLGYVGLPLALLFEEAGFAVTGFDVDAGEARGAARGASRTSGTSAASAWRAPSRAAGSRRRPTSSCSAPATP